MLLLIATYFWNNNFMSRLGYFWLEKSRKGFNVNLKWLSLERDKETSVHDIMTYVQRDDFILRDDLVW